MSGHQFTFPPPPPAPPKASQSYPGFPQPFVGSHGYRGRGSRGDHGHRGNGRSYNHDRSGQRGGHFGSSQPTSSYGNPVFVAHNSQSSQPGMGYGDQINDHKRNGYPLPSYPPVQLPHYPTNLRQGYGQQNAAFVADSQPAQTAYPAIENNSPQIFNGLQQHSSQGHGHSLPIHHSPLPAARNSNPFQTTTHAVQPVLMGPPIRMGFDPQQNSHQTQQHTQPRANGINTHQHRLSNGNDSPYRHSSPVNFSSGHQESSNIFPGYHGRGQKRGHGQAFNRPRNQIHRTQVAPAVPSFGSPLPLPIKPPAFHEHTRKPRKKKRKHNQLGLTPKAEEHESSEEEEDDADEEASLAAVAANAGRGPQL